MTEHTTETQDADVDVWEAEDFFFGYASVASVAEDAQIDFMKPFDRHAVTELLTKWVASEPNVVVVNIDKAVDTLEEYHAEGYMPPPPF